MSQQIRETLFQLNTVLIQEIEVEAVFVMRTQGYDTTLVLTLIRCFKIIKNCHLKILF